MKQQTKPIVKIWRSEKYSVRAAELSQLRLFV